MKFVNAFQKIDLSFGILFLGMGVFIYSLAPAKADQVTATNATGKIMLHQNSFVHGGNFYYHILAWDTETGKSKIYNFSPSTSTLKVAPYQLPSSPLY